MGFSIEVEDVRRHHRRPGGQIVEALTDITLQIDAGDAVTIAGPSGSGKSTLLHVIGAMDQPDAGAIRVDGRDITTLRTAEQSSYRRTIGFVFQRFHLLPALTVLDNVVAPVLPYPTEFDKDSEGRRVLEAVGLAGKETMPPLRLSGGEQQRVAIARALINRPGLLLADEPTGNLDSDTGGDIMALLLDLRVQYGMTILVATHDPLVAARCDRVVRLKDGRIRDDVTVAKGVDSADVLQRITGLDPSL